MCDNHAPLASLRLETKMATLAAADIFLLSVVQGNNEPMFLLFITELTTTVLQNNNFFYLFHSQCRNMYGLCVADNTSVLIKFESLLEIERYIEVVYLEYKDITQ